MLKIKPLRFLAQLRQFSNVGVIGVPFCKGQNKNGVDLGPNAIRQAGLFQDFAEFLPDLKVKDYGDIIYQPTPNLKTTNLKNWSDVSACNHSLSNNIVKIIQDDCVCLTLGGDHSIGLGSVDGHARAVENTEVALLWVDAHADINTETSSPTGHCHGMPVAFLVKELRDQLENVPGLEWQKPRLSLRNVAYIGLRSVDLFERDVINKFGVTAFGMEDVQNYGISTVIKMALNKIDPEKRRSLHVSFDIDSLDVLEAPSTGTAVRGGLTLREGIAIMEAVHKTGRVRVVDLVEVNPSIGTVADVKTTIDAAKQIILAAFGYKRS